MAGEPADFLDRDTAVGYEADEGVPEPEPVERQTMNTYSRPSPPERFTGEVAFGCHRCPMSAVAMCGMN